MSKLATGACVGVLAGIMAAAATLCGSDADSTVIDEEY
eukprot:CAMPEP_0170468584 /NCGR_PEP_ID=MMETSP0123-20130129/11708_1 /TAXON_ID=182087 /ORGANISM="Favella ehrenbergii, Strain Fehren 1" /LENGTH=37 /DNA_ID= /DNA_START= /DNA_END= /DNA_ORIENTATION=